MKELLHLNSRELFTQRNKAEALNLQYEQLSALARKQTSKLQSALRVLHRPNCTDFYTAVCAQADYVR